MKERKKNSDKLESFISEYQKIVDNSKNSVVVRTEWVKKGDYFQKFSMYDNSYVPIKSLGNTTLKKTL